MTRRACIAAAALLSGCVLRTDFARPSGQPLRVLDDPRQAGQVIVVQGDATLDEESVYRMTGDTDAVRLFQDHRRAGAGLRAAGLVPLSLGGLALPFAVAGYLLPVWEEPAPASGALFAAGVSLVVTGLVMHLVGDARARNPDLVLVRDPARMRRQVERYNEALRDR